MASIDQKWEYTNQTYKLIPGLTADQPPGDHTLRSSVVRPQYTMQGTHNHNGAERYTVSYAVERWAWEDSNAKGNAKFILVYLANICDHDGEGAHPSIKRIADAVGVAPRTATDLLKGLSDDGLISVTRGRGPYATNNYSILWPGRHLYRGNDKDMGGQRPEDSAGLSEVRPDGDQRERPAGDQHPDPLVTNTQTIRNNPLTTNTPPVFPPQKPKPSHRVPEDFVPSQSDLKVALELGFTNEKISFEVDRFRDHEFSKAHTDWHAAMRNWFRSPFNGKDAGKATNGVAKKEVYIR